MSEAMSPPSVECVDDRGIRKASLTSPLLALADNGVAVSLPQKTAPATDGVERDATCTRRSLSSCSMEELGDKMAPPTVLHSPSISAMSASHYLKDQIVSFFQVSDNKLAMKLFGNKSALMREKLRHRAVSNWVIHPCSNFRQVSLTHS